MKMKKIIEIIIIITIIKIIEIIEMIKMIKIIKIFKIIKIMSGMSSLFGGQWSTNKILSVLVYIFIVLFPVWAGINNSVSCLEKWNMN